MKTVMSKTNVFTWLAYFVHMANISSKDYGAHKKVLSADQLVSSAHEKDSVT